MCASEHSKKYIFVARKPIISADSLRNSGCLSQRMRYRAVVKAGLIMMDLFKVRTDIVQVHFAEVIPEQRQGRLYNAPCGNEAKVMRTEDRAVRS